MAQTRRAQRATCEEIKEVAREQMAEQGAAGISLRAIAGRMRLTAPALYRYYKNRDELITALIVDAFDALGETTGAAFEGHAGDDYAGRFAAAMLAYRDWALAHRADFVLIYGTPIPGYEAPAEITAPAARRSLAPVVALLGEAYRAGRLSAPPEYADTPPVVREHLTEWSRQSFDYDMPPAVMHTGFTAWTRLQGLIMLELFGHIHPVVGDPGALYRAEIRAILQRMGMLPTG